MTRILELRYRTDAAPLFAAVRDLPNPVWLDSSRPQCLTGRFDIISAAPLRVLSTPACGAAALTGAAELFAALSPPSEPPAPIRHLPFVGGLIGWLGYDLGSDLVGIPRSAPEVAGLPVAQIGFYAWAVIVDHEAQRSQFVFHPACPPALRRDVAARCRAAPRDLPAPKHGFALDAPFVATTSAARYRADVARILDYLAAGDCYQVNYAQHFSAAFRGDPWHAYRRLRALLPSPFSAYFVSDFGAVLSFSPERFLRVHGADVQTRPIKGTIARGRDAEEDTRLAQELQTSAKDRAENLMIVDLLRNDLGKSCTPGSIAVPELFVLESFANVHHLVSTVTGRLRADQTPLDLLANCFPGGSVTGAPKKRAMEIIAELEPVARSVYCGSIFYLSAHGRMDSSIAIRTLVTDGARIHCWGGGGVVADSDPEAEYRESLVKVRLLMAALEA